ncbi:MAG: hypothetical protein E3J94_02810 [Desulfobacteraceae bacterium]|nr:MAG: hypothetical protein E3J94_02810 [Desulfobacteraceae bacterium]
MLTKYKIAILRVIIDNAQKSEAGYFWSSVRFVSTALSSDHEISLLPESVERYVALLRSEGYLKGSSEPKPFNGSFCLNAPANLQVTQKGVEYLRVIDV